MHHRVVGVHGVRARQQGLSARQDLPRVGLCLQAAQRSLAVSTPCLHLLGGEGVHVLQACSRLHGAVLHLSVCVNDATSRLSEVCLQVMYWLQRLVPCSATCDQTVEARWRGQAQHLTNHALLPEGAATKGLMQPKSLHSARPQAKS